jgi:putative copper export protein
VINNTVWTGGLLLLLVVVVEEGTPIRNHVIQYNSLQMF